MYGETSKKRVIVIDSILCCSLEVPEDDTA